MIQYPTMCNNIYFLLQWFIPSFFPLSGDYFSERSEVLHSHTKSQNYKKYNAFSSLKILLWGWIEFSTFIAINKHFLLITYSFVLYFIFLKVLCLLISSLSHQNNPVLSKVNKQQSATAEQWQHDLCWGAGLSKGLVCLKIGNGKIS